MNLNYGGRRYKVEDILTKIPSGVNETQDNIALLRISEDISMGEMAMPWEK